MGTSGACSGEPDSRRSTMAFRSDVQIINPVDQVVVAIAEETRWRLLHLLAFGGESTATELAANLGVSRPAVSRHLQILERCGLARLRRSGREVRVQLRPARLEETSQWFARLASDWSARATTPRAAGDPEQR